MAARRSRGTIMAAQLAARRYSAAARTPSSPAARRRRRPCRPAAAAPSRCRRRHSANRPRRGPIRRPAPRTMTLGHEPSGRSDRPPSPNRPRVVGNPIPAPVVGIDPVAVFVRPPVARHAVRHPDLAIRREAHPMAVGIERGRPCRRTLCAMAGVVAPSDDAARRRRRRQAQAVAGQARGGGRWIG